MDSRERERKEKKLAFLKRRNDQREQIADGQGGLKDAPELYVEDRAALEAELNPEDEEKPAEDQFSDASSDDSQGDDASASGE